MRDEITPEERRLIDEYIARRGVTKIKPMWFCEEPAKPKKNNKRAFSSRKVSAKGRLRMTLGNVLAARERVIKREGALDDAGSI